MLYDNAQLARVYVHAWSVTGDATYLGVATGVLDYVLRELTTPDGAFAASQDADTDGVEGGTFTWRGGEIRDVLGDDAALFSAAYGVTEEGNWEGVTILSRMRSTPELAGAFGLTVREVDEALARSRERLLAVRGGRAQPARDDKALAAWNGLAIAALADAARAIELGGDDTDGASPGAARLETAERYKVAAARAAEAITSGLLRTAEDGAAHLGRSWKDGRATGQGVLEDYADLADGLLALYEATFDERWFATARSLMDAVLERFADADGGFFDTATDHERLFTRPRDVQDNATPSGGAAATVVLLRLAALTGEGRYRTAAERAIGQVAPLAARYPTAFAKWLEAIDLSLSNVTEVAVVGDLASSDGRALLRVAGGGYNPARVLAAGPGDGQASEVPLLRDRPLLRGRPTAYVCRGFACRAPVTDPDALREQLAEQAAAL